MDNEKVYSIIDWVIEINEDLLEQIDQLKYLLERDRYKA